MATEFDKRAELWKIANVATGFAVAQGIAFAFALGKDLGGLQSQSVPVKLGLTAVSIVFAAFYTLAVYRCWTLASPDEAAENVWRGVTYGRYTAIGLFTGLGIFGLFAPNLFGHSLLPLCL